MVMTARDSVSEIGMSVMVRMIVMMGQMKAIFVVCHLNIYRHLFFIIKISQLFIYNSANQFY